MYFDKLNLVFWWFIISINTIFKHFPLTFSSIPSTLLVNVVLKYLKCVLLLKNFGLEVSGTYYTIHNCVINCFLCVRIHYKSILLILGVLSCTIDCGSWNEKCLLLTKRGYDLKVPRFDVYNHLINDIGKHYWTQNLSYKLKR